MRAIRAFIARDSEFYAARLVARIIGRVERVALAPQQGHRVHEHPGHPLKEVHEPPYRVIYAIADDVIEIVTIVQFKQQLKARSRAKG